MTFTCFGVVSGLTSSLIIPCLRMRIDLVRDRPLASHLGELLSGQTGQTMKAKMLRQERKTNGRGSQGETTTAGGTEAGTKMTRRTTGETTKARGEMTVTEGAEDHTQDHVHHHPGAKNVKTGTETPTIDKIAAIITILDVRQERYRLSLQL
jgi:hypothetical protein